MREPVVKFLYITVALYAGMLPFIMKSFWFKSSALELSESTFRNDDRFLNELTKKTDHAPSHMYQYFYTPYSSYQFFTTAFPILTDSGQLWSGTWTELQKRDQSYIANFENRNSIASARFLFEPAIMKSTVTLTIADDKYFDSGKLHVNVNLKMGTLDRSTSSIVVQGQAGQEYYSTAILQEQCVDQKNKTFYDIFFNLTFVNLTSNSPLDLSANDYASCGKLKIRVTSVALGIDIDASLESSQLTVVSGWTVGCVLFLFTSHLFISIVSFYFTNDPIFFKNVSFVVYAIFAVFYYHIYTAMAVMLEIQKHYTWIYIILGMVSFGMSLYSFLNFLRSLLSFYEGRVAHREISICAMTTICIIFMVIVGVMTILYLFSRSYKVYLALTFIFPLIQIYITTVLASNRQFFKVSYQLLDWFGVVAYAIFMKGIPNDLMNVSPCRPIIYISVFSVMFGAIFMYLQSRFGVYFWLPKSLIPGYINLDVPFHKVPIDKHDTECAICLHVLKVDPEKLPRVPDDHIELEEQLRDNTLVREGERLNPELHPRVLMKMPCDHYFHKKCLQEWLRTRQACPMCSRVIQYFEG